MCEDIKFWLLKAKWQNGNFLLLMFRFGKAYRSLEKLKTMYLVVLNMDPYSPIDASWEIRVELEMLYLG